MKMTTVMMIGVFTLGPGYALADHHGDDWRHQAHHKHYKKAGHHYGKARMHHRIARGHERALRREARGHFSEANYGRVIDVEPVYRYYKEPVNAHSCIQYDRGRADYTSHTGTVLGAVIGGALGHRIGDAHGDPTAAAVAGGVLGASLGRDIQHRANYQRALRVEGPCRIRQHEQTRRQLVEYKVTYRYNGEVRHARMNYDPGEWVKLDVDITPA